MTKINACYIRVFYNPKSEAVQLELIDPDFMRLVTPGVQPGHA